jgi:arylsulfatase A-like enzyme
MSMPTSHKSLLATVVAIVLATICVCACRAASPALPGDPPGSKPNVLFIIVDDLRPELGCYGKTEVRSPNMDRLASEGLLFRRAYCQFALCMPSRSSVLSGFRPESIHKTLRVSGHVPKGTVTLPQLFRNNGYATVSIGKVYHMNNDDPAAWARRYTDTFSEGNGYCSGYQLAANRDLVQNYFHGKRPASPIVESVDAPDAAHPDARIATHAVEELRKFKASGEPFFLAAGFYRPHMPCTAPKKYWDLYDRKDIRLPANFKPVEDEIPRPDWDEVRRYGDCPRHGAMPEDKAREIIHGYHASVSFVDAQIGEVLDELRSLGLDRNTVVVLWGDNGWNLGDHGRWSKMTDYETSTRVAMMLKVPWMAGNRKTDALVELVDIYPTLCELCRLLPPAYLEGTSVLPLLANPQRPWKAAAFSCLFDTKSRTLRTDRYRLIEHPDGQIELYDHGTDPAEDHNLAKDPAFAGTLRGLQAALEAGWRGVRPARSD